MVPDTSAASTASTQTDLNFNQSDIFKAGHSELASKIQQRLGYLSTVAQKCKAEVQQSKTSTKREFYRKKLKKHTTEILQLLAAYKNLIK